ncbi:JAB domain-containing protein [Aquimarina hainanensis]|uniref:JAB domain-containing protein n=1 Tax=Aquimarina hainanensis TaxID=1578017 RepID=A0ABW5N7C2_9FLAO
MKTKLPAPYTGSTPEIELHYKRPVFDSMFSIREAKDACKILRKTVHPKRWDLKEMFFVILLTNSNSVLGIAELGSGTTEAVKVNIKEIFQLALVSNASALIICHNHPSGKMVISPSDKAITKNIQELANQMGFTLLDHIIITSEDYISFAEEHLL